MLYSSLKLPGNGTFPSDPLWTQLVMLQCSVLGTFVTAGRHYVWQQDSAACHKTREHSHGCQIFYVVISSHLTPKTAGALIIKCGVKLNERPTKVLVTQNMN